MTRIKICGITEAEQALAAAEGGADYLGLVFARSPRQINPQRAVSIVHAVSNTVEKPQVVGVFVNLPASDINFIAESCRLDWVQLSGDESWEFCLQINKPVIRAIHVFYNTKAEFILNEIKTGFTYLPPENLKILLDSRTKEAFGGTGKTFDWKLAREVSARYPVFVGGGLNPENVAQMVKDVQPWGVDVSTGVETKGKKDIEKIKQFIRKVKSTR
ncbi:MAG TPA: phosphoribosylanthranilate isomerase [Dehalococcoidales bacterium]|nr:phosphoribosylanthranilate isomerase [Dehalococcoidales bacterium]